MSIAVPEEVVYKLRMLLMDIDATYSLSACSVEGKLSQNSMRIWDAAKEILPHLSPLRSDKPYKIGQPQTPTRQGGGGYDKE